MKPPPRWYADWRRPVEFDDVEYGVGGIRLVLPHEIPNAQVGYALSENGDSLAGTASGDWQPDWVVIGHELACGDPIFASDSAPHPVFTAMHGEGPWEARLVAPSLETFLQCLNEFRTLAAGRANPVELEANPPTEEQQIQFLEAIRAVIGDNLESLDFWAVLIETDVEALDL